MLNQERVCEMTRLAMFDQKEGRKCKPMIQYFRKDYIAKEMLKSFLSGTIAFFVVLIVFAVYGAEQLLRQINTIDIRQTATRVLLWYVAWIGIYCLITYVVYHIRYTKGRQKVKEYYIHLRMVNRLYQEEESM